MQRKNMAWGTLAILGSVATALVLMSTFVGVAAADSHGSSIFSPFQQIDGSEQAQPISDTLGGFPLDGTNKFFDPGLGTNGQACVTCHQPADGFDIHVSSIQKAFSATGGTDPLFRCNDTADNPFTC